MMKRSLLAWMAVMFAAASANAVATVTVISTGELPYPGGTITFEVYVSVGPGDGLDGSLFGSLLYPSADVAPASRTQFPFPSDGAPYGTGTPSCTTGASPPRCIVFNQVAGSQGPQSGNLSNFLIATQSYTVLPSTPLGVVLSWFWQTAPSTQALSFYNAVPTVPAISITVVPEPTPAALLGLGLLGLAAARRRS